MNFNFIPYRLKEDISDFYINDIEYIDTDNGVDLYKAREGLEIQILGLRFKVINFYFYQRKLITIYFHLVEDKIDIEECVSILEKEIGMPFQSSKIASGLLFFWKNEEELFGLIKDNKSRKAYWYYSTLSHSIFN